MRALSSALLLGFLAACAPSLPDSGAGVGFDNSVDAQRAREASLSTGQPLVPGPVLSDEVTSGGLASAQPVAQPTVRAGPAPPVVDTSVSAQDIADQTAIALAAGSDGTAPPTRPGGAQPDIVEFALSTSNPRGTSLYKRSGSDNAAVAARNCAGFASPDQAQRAFLSEGGPETDRQGLDPDGDGFACSWDPAPFRRAANN